MAVEIAFVGLMVVSAVVAMAVRRLELPYTIALVVAGLLLGLLRPEGEAWEAFYSLHLEPELLFAIFLPALLYEAALHVELSELARSWRTITLLAVPGVLIGALVCGLGTWAGLGPAGVDLPFVVALMFGALICATDPIAVIAMLGELGVSRKLRVLLEGESLLNDGTAVVLFGVVAALAGVTSHGGETIDALWVARLFLWEVGVGFAIGLAVGVVHFWVTSKVDDHLIEITLTTVAAFGSYLLAHSAHASGVIAVVTAGLLAGNYGKRFGMSPATRIRLLGFWEYVTFVANSLVFLLIGLEIDLARLWDHGLVVLVAWAATVLGRAAAVGLALPILGRSRERLPGAWAAVLTWGGLHGALSMVLALSLPPSFVHRGLVIDLAFGTVLLSILVQGLTVGPLVRRLGLSVRHADGRLHGQLLARLQAIAAARADLEARRRAHHVTATVAARVEADLDERKARAEAELEALRTRSGHLEEEELREVREHLLVVEKDSLARSLAEGLLDDESMRELGAELDLRLTDIEASRHGEDGG